MLDETLALATDMGMKPLMEKVLSKREILKAEGRAIAAARIQETHTRCGGRLDFRLGQQPHSPPTVTQR